MPVGTDTDGECSSLLWRLVIDEYIAENRKNVTKSKNEGIEKWPMD